MWLLHYILSITCNCFGLHFRQHIHTGFNDSTYIFYLSLATILDWIFNVALTFHSFTDYIMAPGSKRSSANSNSTAMQLDAPNPQPHTPHPEATTTSSVPSTATHASVAGIYSLSLSLSFSLLYNQASLLFLK